MHTSRCSHNRRLKVCMAPCFTTLQLHPCQHGLQTSQLGLSEFTTSHCWFSQFRSPCFLLQPKRVLIHLRCKLLNTDAKHLMCPYYSPTPGASGHLLHSRLIFHNPGQVPEGLPGETELNNNIMVQEFRD